MTDAPLHHDLTILYVEDERATLEQIHRILHARGYHLILAENGCRGLELYREHRPDIVVTDIMMPLMNGLDMAREIRAVSPDAQIIIMTAFSDIELMLQAIDVGINQFVLKPVDIRKLFDAVSRCSDVVMMQRRLREQHEHIRILSNALEQSPSIAFITDTSGVIEYVNRKFCEVTGYSAEEAIGSTSHIIKSEATTPEQYRQMWDTILKGEEWHGVMQNRRKNGETYWECVSISPLLDENGVPVKFVRTGEDITALKKLEEEALTARKLEATGILAGGMAHDFNNLLQVILGYLSLIRMNVHEPEKILDMLDVIDKSSQQARELSQRLLAFASSGELQMHRLPLSPLLVRAVDEFRSRTDISFELEVAPDLHDIYMNDSQVLRVFTNLTANAVEAMPHGGVLKVTAANLKLADQEIAILPAGEYVHIAFRDTGNGIAPENLHKVFDPYFSTKTLDSTKGRGLGLSLCHSIISKHKGSISVESVPGCGATFHLYLPASC